MSDALCKNILKDSGKTIASPAEMETLRKAQSQYEIALDGLNQFNPAAAQRDWIQHKSDLVDAIEGFGGIFGVPALTLDDFLKAYRMKTEAHKEKMRKICQSILPLADKICKRFMAVANDKAAAVAEAELQAHTAYGITHRPSSLVTAFGRAAEYARNRCVLSEYAAASPRQLLPYLDI